MLVLILIHQKLLNIKLVPSYENINDYKIRIMLYEDNLKMRQAEHVLSNKDV